MMRFILMLSMIVIYWVAIEMDDRRRDTVIADSESVWRRDASSKCGSWCSISGSASIQNDNIVVGDVVPVSIDVKMACDVPPKVIDAPAEIVILFSHSRMMIHNTEQLSAAKEAANLILDGVVPGRHRVALIAHTYEITMIRMLTNDMSAIRAGIDSREPITHLKSSSVYTALEMVNFVIEEDRRPGVPVVVVLIGKGDLEDRDVVGLADSLRRDGYRIFAIGFADSGQRVDRLKRIVGNESHYFPGTSSELVQFAVHSLLTGLFPVKFERQTLEVREMGELPILPGTSYPVATELPTTILWGPESMTGGDVRRSYKVRATMPGVFPVARAITVGYEVCPGVPGQVALLVPEVLVLAPTPQIEVTPTREPTLTVPPPSSSLTPEAAATSSPTATEEVLSTSTVKPLPKHYALYHPLLSSRRRR